MQCTYRLQDSLNSKSVRLHKRCGKTSGPIEGVKLARAGRLCCKKFGIPGDLCVYILVAGTIVACSHIALTLRPTQGEKLIGCGRRETGIRETRVPQFLRTA